MMAYVVFQFFVSALVIVFAGSFLTKFVDKIAEITGWGRMFAGSLLLAGATSIPELMVDLKSVQLDLPNLAVGDLLGSSLFNLLILALLDFTFPSVFRRTAFSPAFLHHSLSAMLTIVLTSFVGIAIASRIDISFLGISIFSWAIVLSYLFGMRLIYMEEASGKYSRVADEASCVKAPRSIFRNKDLYISSAGYLSCTFIIFLAAPYLVKSADQFAKLSNLGHTFIGTTLVAFSTSLPELVATLSAFKMGAPDLAIGNIFGSNAFNMLLFVPLDFMYSKVVFSSVGIVHALTAFNIILATSIAVMGQLYRKKERSRFLDPSSEMVVIVLFLAIVLLYFVKSP
jgi:cation:H+ antiporter